MAGVRHERWSGEDCVALEAGELAARFLPATGMLGVSLTHRGAELLALPHDVATYRVGGGWTGLSLLHPFANRLSVRRFGVLGRTVWLPEGSTPSDPDGLPIHGVVHRHAFHVEAPASPSGGARLSAVLDWHDGLDDFGCFPFVHRVVVRVDLDGAALAVRTEVEACGADDVPVSFGWHPYFRLPASATLRVPACEHVLLDERHLPDGRREAQPAGAVALRRAALDDHYALGDDRTFVLETGAPRPRRTLTLDLDDGYPHAQLYRPPGGAFVCIEPMVAAVDALVAGTAPVVRAGNRAAATFRLTVT